MEGSLDDFFRVDSLRRVGRVGAGEQSLRYALILGGHCVC